MKKALLVGLCSISTLSLVSCGDSSPEYIGGQGDFKISQYPSKALVKATGSMVQYTVSGLPTDTQNSLCISVGKETVCDSYEDEHKRKYHFTYPTSNDRNAYIVVPVSFLVENSKSDNKVDNGELDTNISVFYYNPEHRKEYRSNVIDKITLENPRIYKLEEKKKYGFNNNNSNDSLKVTLSTNPNFIYAYSNTKTEYGYLKKLDYDNSITENSIKAVNSNGNNNFQINGNVAAKKDASLTFTIERKGGIRGDAIVAVPMNNNQDVMRFEVLNDYKSYIKVKDVDGKISNTSKYVVKEIHGLTDNVALKCYAPAEHCDKLKIGNVRKDNVVELVGIKREDLEAVKDKTFYINVVNHITGDEDRVVEQFILNFNNVHTYSTINLKKGNVLIDKGFTIYKSNFAGAFFSIRSDINFDEKLRTYDVKTDVSVSREPILQRMEDISPSKITLLEIENGINNPYIELLNEKTCINTFNLQECKINIRPIQNSVLEKDPTTTSLTITAGAEKRVYNVKVVGNENK